MSAIVAIVFFMICLIPLGKNAKSLGMREYLILVLVTAAQIGVVILYLFTVERPPIV
jgi:hypothetical protein